MKSKSPIPDALQPSMVRGGDASEVGKVQARRLSEPIYESPRNAVPLYEEIDDEPKVTVDGILYELGSPTRKWRDYQSASCLYASLYDNVQPQARGGNRVHARARLPVLPKRPALSI